MSVAGRTIDSSVGAVGPEDGGRARSIAMLMGTLVLVIAAFGLMTWLTSDPERRLLIEGLVGSPLGLVVLFGLAALSTATLILPAPGLVLTAVAGSAGDPLLVGAVAGLGQATGELTGFLAGRGGRSLLPNTSAIDRVNGWLQRRGVLVVFVLALVPNPVFDVAGVAAGALGMGLWRYLAAAASGKVIKNVVVAVSGSMLSGIALILLVRPMAA